MAAPDPAPKADVASVPSATRGIALPAAKGTRWAWAALLGLALLLLPEAVKLETRPLDGSAQLAGLVLAHPARRPGEPLWLLGPATQAADFYSDYAVTRPAAPPQRRPQEACVVATKDGWVFYPAQDARPGRR